MCDKPYLKYRYRLVFTRNYDIYRYWYNVIVIRFILILNCFLSAGSSTTPAPVPMNQRAKIITVDASEGKEHHRIKIKTGKPRQRFVVADWGTRSNAHWEF